MWSLRDVQRTDRGQDLLGFALGAAGGLALGLLIARLSQPAASGAGADLLRRRARAAVRRFGPARLRREPIEQAELMELEDAVIDALLDDEVLRERGIDVGALSVGIVELSGSLESDEEIERAVRVANAVPGVRTVVNRLDTAQRGGRAAASMTDDDDAAATEWGWSGMRSGMGRRRQGRQTEPDRPDESQASHEAALDAADRVQWNEEGWAAKNPRSSARSDVRDPNRPDGLADDELDNQDPHGKHAGRTLDEPPQEYHTERRVGEGLKPGTELDLEKADVPLKPHQMPPNRPADEG